MEEMNQKVIGTVLWRDDKWKQLGGRRQVSAWDISKVETIDFGEQLDSHVIETISGKKEVNARSSWHLQAGKENPQLDVS